MREVIGCWPVIKRGRNGCFAGYQDYEIVIDDGVMVLIPSYGAWERRVDFKRAFGKRFFGDSEFLIGCIGEFVDKIILECDGKDLDGVHKVAEKYLAKRREKRTRDFSEKAKWSELKDRFDGVVIGIDKNIDVYGTGFSVRVVFSSDVSFKDRAAFLKENRADFVRWVMKEISDSKKIVGKIGDIRFYKPVEIVNLRAHEVEVKFEVKEGVA